MLLFLFEGKCLSGALLRLAREGDGTRRAASIFRLVQSHGGKRKTVYYGEHDKTLAIARMPNEESAKTFRQSIRATWDMDVTIRPMMSPAKFDIQNQNNDDLLEITRGCFPPKKEAVLGKETTEDDVKVPVPMPMPRTLPSSLALHMI